ncbi:hypothetical protein [Caproiciproducens galactitolivorans]|uniref:Lipoprotein n=1 Tax=Caproiciproducens galactitolivorans TaxID=642589 RepID=A0ABT4BUQ1_9FIRM|nr:hypothetical protein [Caproiciproducens galactitolivorans]MCY1713651.1 hypothetical protein [Caproiciproducens galactitolivorans]
MNKKRNNVSLITLSAALFLTAGLAVLSGCGAKETSASPSANTSVTASGSATDNSASSDAETTEGVPPVQSTQNAPAESGDKTLENTLDGYVKLLGLDKDELVKAVGEKPDSSDEGGQDFKKADIRVWFDAKSGTVNQLFTQNKDIDLNGVKIGDTIDKFEEVFGKPVSDRNGDIHFKYNDIFLSLNYDTTTKETFALYLLTVDF